MTVNIDNDKAVSLLKEYRESQTTLLRNELFELLRPAVEAAAIQVFNVQKNPLVEQNELIQDTYVWLLDFIDKNKYRPESGLIQDYTFISARNFCFDYFKRTSDKKTTPLDDNELTCELDDSMTRDDLDEYIRQIVQLVLKNEFGPYEYNIAAFILNCALSGVRFNQKMVDCKNVTPSRLKFLQSYVLYTARRVLNNEGVLDVPHDFIKYLRKRYCDTLLSALGDLIGWDQIVKIVALLGGFTIRIPSLSDFSQDQRDMSVFRILKGANQTPDLQSDLVLRVAKSHRISPHAVMGIYRRFEALEAQEIQNTNRC